MGSIATVVPGPIALPSLERLTAPIKNVFQQTRQWLGLYAAPLREAAVRFRQIHRPLLMDLGTPIAWAQPTMADVQSRKLKIRPGPIPLPPEPDSTFAYKMACEISGRNLAFATFLKVNFFPPQNMSETRAEYAARIQPRVDLLTGRLYMQTFPSQSAEGKPKYMLSLEAIATFTRQEPQQVLSYLNRAGLHREGPLPEKITVPEPVTIDDYVALYSSKTTASAQKKRECLTYFKEHNVAGEELACAMYVLTHERPEDAHELHKDKYVFTQKETARMCGMTTRQLNKLVEKKYGLTRAALTRDLKQRQMDYLASLPQVDNPPYLAKQLGIGKKTLERYLPMSPLLAA